MKQFFILKKYITKKGKGGRRRRGQRKGKGEEEKKKKKKWERWGMERQISLVGAALETYSQIRAVSKVFLRGCFFCTYPAWDAPVLLATSCMADTCRTGEGRASSSGDFVHDGQVAGRTRQHCWRFQAGTRHCCWRFLPILL